MSLSRLITRLMESVFSDDPPINKVVVQIRVRDAKGNLIQRQFAPVASSPVTLFPGVAAINVDESDVRPGDDPSCLDH